MTYESDSNQEVKCILARINFGLKFPKGNLQGKLKDWREPLDHLAPNKPIVLDQNLLPMNCLICEYQVT